MRVCPECLSNNLSEDVCLQEISCKHCGLVLEAPYEYGIVHQGVLIVSHRKRSYIVMSNIGNSYNISFFL